MQTKIHKIQRLNQEVFLPLRLWFSAKTIIEGI